MNSPADIIAAVAAVTGVPVAAITGRRRTRRVVIARWLAIAAIRARNPHLTLESTGAIFRRDHGTIIHAGLRHREMLRDDAVYARLHRQIREDLATHILAALV